MFTTFWDNKEGTRLFFYFCHCNKALHIAAFSINIFPAKEETSIEYTRKEILSTIYNVEHNTLPAFRIEPITNLEKELIFEGYQQVPKEDSQRTEPEYKQGDQLLYVKALLRPKYTQ